MTDPSATPVLPAAVVHGCAAGPAVPDVLLIHGAGGDHRHFPPALTDLPGVRVHALDLPGHGAAEGRFADSVEVYADAVAAYVESCGLTRVVLAGHSMGGAVVMTLALRAPAWLRAQVLIGTGSRLKVLPVLFDLIDDDWPGAVATIVSGLFGPDADPAQVEAVRGRYLDGPPARLRADLRACTRFDIGERLGTLRLPTLVVSGALDVMTPPKYGRALAAAIPGAHHVEIAGAGHMLALERPQAVRAAIAGFLNTLDHAQE